MCPPRLRALCGRGLLFAARTLPFIARLNATFEERNRLAKIITVVDSLAKAEGEILTPLQPEIDQPHEHNTEMLRRDVFADRPALLRDRDSTSKHIEHGRF